MAEIVFEDEAKAEFLAASAWYRQHSPVAADRFIDEVERATAMVADAPERWRRRGDARQYAIHCFPYGLVYRYDKDRDLVTVVAVAHLKRRPGYWRTR